MKFIGIKGKRIISKIIYQIQKSYRSFNESKKDLLKHIYNTFLREYLDYKIKPYGKSILNGYRFYIVENYLDNYYFDFYYFTV